MILKAYSPIPTHRRDQTSDCLTAHGSRPLSGSCLWVACGYDDISDWSFEELLRRFKHSLLLACLIGVCVGCLMCFLFLFLSFVLFLARFSSLVLCLCADFCTAYVVCCCNLFLSETAATNNSSNTHNKTQTKQSVPWSFVVLIRLCYQIYPFCPSVPGTGWHRLAGLQEPFDWLHPSTKYRKI